MLRKRVQEEIDKTEARHGQIEESNQVLRRIEYDAILLGYCLCSNGIVGLSSRKVPLIIPRGHDCITLLLGSREKYQEYFNTHRGSIGTAPAGSKGRSHRARSATNRSIKATWKDTARTTRIT